MISRTTNVVVSGVDFAQHRSSVHICPVCSITARRVGSQSMHLVHGRTTSLWSKRIKVDDASVLENMPLYNLIIGFTVLDQYEVKWFFFCFKCIYSTKYFFIVFCGEFRFLRSLSPHIIVLQVIVLFSVLLINKISKNYLIVYLRNNRLFVNFIERNIQ